MKNRIILKNLARVGRKLGVELKTYEIKDGKRDFRHVNPRKQLEESKEWTEFKKKYAEYFETVEPKKLAEFFGKTGLRITHLIKDKKNNMTFLFTMFGWTYEGYIEHAYDCSADKLIFGYNNLPRGMRSDNQFEKLPWGGRVHMEHILVCSEIDDINDLDFEFREEDIMKIGGDVRSLNYELYTAKNEDTDMDEEAEKKDLKGERNERGNKIKKEFYDTFSEHVVLYENGELYVDDKLYDEKVRGIFSQDSANVIIVFDNNTVEMLSAYEEYTDDYYLATGEYNKIEMNEMMLALLSTSRGGGNNLLVISVDFNLPDTSVVCSYENVGDIELREFSNDEDYILRSLSSRRVMKPADLHNEKEIHLVGLPMVNAPFADE